MTQKYKYFLTKLHTATDSGLRFRRT